MIGQTDTHESYAFNRIVDKVCVQLKEVIRKIRDHYNGEYVATVTPHVGITIPLVDNAAFTLAGIVFVPDAPNDGVTTFKFNLSCRDVADVILTLEQKTDTLEELDVTGYLKEMPIRYDDLNSLVFAVNEIVAIVNALIALPDTKYGI